MTDDPAVPSPAPAQTPDALSNILAEDAAHWANEASAFARRLMESQARVSALESEVSSLRQQVATAEDERDSMDLRRHEAFPSDEEMEALARFIDYGATRAMHDGGLTASDRDTALYWRSRMRRLIEALHAEAIDAGLVPPAQHQGTP